MRIRILVTGSMVAAMAGSLSAADPQLLKLVMPDAKVVSDVNVAQAKVTPFGQYVLNQLANSNVEQFTALTGFDPSKDLNELLCASNGTTPNTGVALATGIFDPTKIAALSAKNGGVSETYRGVMILENPTKTEGVAFLNPGVMAAGDVADVKAAIDRQSAPSTLPKSLSDQITTLSNLNDAWALTTVPPSSLPHASVKNPQQDVGGVNIPANVLTQVTSGYAGVKFGSNITVTAQAQTTNAQAATNLAGMLQLLQNLALMQSQQSANAGALAKAVTITADGTAVNVTASLPEDQFQALIQQKPHTAHKVIR